MTEAFTASNAENRRCLPAWMLKPCSNNEAAKAECRNEPGLESEERPGTVDEIKPIKRKSRRRLKAQDTEDADQVGVLRQCQIRESTGRRSKGVVKDEGEDADKRTDKDERKVSGRAVKKNSRKRKWENVGADVSSSGTTDGEIELTVEDLVRIAEEYVNADKQKQIKLESMKTTHHQEHSPCPSISTATTREESLPNAQATKGLLQCTTIRTSCPSCECGRDENKSHEELQCSSSIPTTGDAAQDMLDLFLGPLLRKLPGGENKTKAVETITTNISYEPEKKDVHSEVQKQGEPVTKKKSSLKDKVALFL